eukprot:5948776-Pleurochrysis_carterae.AAC.1
MVFIVRGNRHHVKHTCRSDASDWAAVDILHIPPSALTAVNASLWPTWGRVFERVFCIIIVSSGYHILVWETPVRCTATAVALRVATRQRGACFEA